MKNIYSTQPVAELAPSLMDKLYEDKDYLSKALVANLFKKARHRRPFTKNKG